MNLWPSVIHLNQNEKIGNQGEKKFGLVITFIFLSRLPYRIDRQNTRKKWKAVHLQKKLKKHWQVPPSIKIDSKKEWKKFYPISNVPNSPGEFRCTVYDYILSCFCQSEADVKRHIQGAVHQKKWKSLKSMKTLSSFGFRPNDDNIREWVWKLCYIAVGSYLKYKGCLLITFFYLFYKLFHV